MNDDNEQTKWRRFEQIRNPRHIRRRLRKIETSTLKHGHTFIVARWQNIRLVRRQIIGWLLLTSVLIVSIILQVGIMRSSYQHADALEGGTFAEGVVGDLKSLNPILAQTGPERAVSKLFFAGLLKYDESGRLINDLAERVTISEGGKRYTVTLKPNLKWQNGAELTTKDVVFTFETIKNPDVRSPMQPVWSNVVISQPQKGVVQFDLAEPYAPFAHSLTTGIIPATSFEDKTADIRTSSFDKQPITNGPFAFRNMQVIDETAGRFTVHGIANPHYNAGKVKLNRFQLHVYPGQDELRRAFLSGEINAAADFSTQDVKQLKSAKNIEVKEGLLNNVVLAIFNTTGPMLQDVNLRKALVVGTDRSAIIKDALSGYGRKLDSPMPTALLQKNSPSSQAAYDFKSADEQLTKLGWVKGTDGTRTKDGQPLKLSVAALNTGDYPKVLEKLTEQWSRLGVQSETVLVNPEDALQNLLAPRAYDALVYELPISSDPDVYAYWHSSQADERGLNLANLRSGKIDDTLVSARSRYEPDLRLAKYETFINDWLAEAPGVVLYQSTLHYVSNSNVKTFKDGASLSEPTDRYQNVRYWSVTEGLVNNTP